MQLSELNHLDSALGKAIAHLKEKWYDPSVGIVSAAAGNASGDLALATSVRTHDDRWLHAERNAVLLFKTDFPNEPPPIFVVSTLSPCVANYSRSRDGPSCTSILRKEQISHVLVGAIDKKQVESLNAYLDFGITASLTDNTEYHQICINLLGLFVKYGNQVNSDLIGIKSKEDFNKLFLLQ